MKFFKKVLASALAVTMLMSCATFNTVTVLAAPSISAGWNETLYAEWADSNPDSPNVKVGYKLSTADSYTYLEGNDLTYLVRPASTSGYGRVDIPGIKAGRYDIQITASDGTVHERKGIKVYAYDRSGYAHFNNTSGVGAYNDDGTPKDNAIIVYVTEENKDTVEIPGYEGHAAVAYASSTTGETWTRGTAGVGNILNNNHKFIREVTGTDNHPIIFRFIGEVTPPKNLTPYNTKTNELGGSKGDNGNLAITKYAKNITIEGIGDDATINGWGFTFSQTSTCPSDTGENFEVRNLTFKNYTEDALGFQGDDGIECPIRRVWVHNNVFYPGYCANPAESDKADGDGSCDFKRGQYYTMSYNHYIKCHKTNLLGASASNYQYNMSLHHNWYEQVAARQPLGASGNAHIYNTYFDNSTGTTIDLRGATEYFLENNYLENCKESYKSRNNTSNMKIYGDIVVDSDVKGGSKETIKGTKTVVTSRDASGLPDNGLTLIDGTSAADFDTNSKEFYYDSVNKVSDVEVMNDAEDVPSYVTTYAGVLHQFPETESGEITITVKSGDTAIKDASVTANGLKFTNNGDGTYTATAQLGSEYIIKASKEGYSNATVTSEVLENDGDTFTATLDLPVDYDGYAVVSLTGGSSNAPVKGATVKLADGTVLADQGDGTYKSANQLAVGSYKVTVTNTGDYVAPTSAQDIAVKTTDEATAIHLDKLQGSVSVKLAAKAGETETLGLSRATVYVGTTALKNSGNGTFTGKVDINTPYEVLVNVPGWSVESITPETLTAAKSGTATANVTLSYQGQLYTWNYTEGTNTNDFFTVSGESDWSSAAKNPVEFDGETLTKAIKVTSGLTITFDAPSDGELTIVSDAKSGSSMYLNDVSYSLSDNIIKVPVTAGLNTLKKNKTESHLYLLQYVGANDDDDEVTTGLNDEIMWDTSDTLSGTINGLTFGESMASNEEENGARDFVEGDNTYQLSTWVQGKANPYNASGLNPQSADTTDRIPATGSFIKFVPESNGTFTFAAKTNGGKTTYVTDENGTVLTSIGDATTDTSYDVVRTQVKANKAYYIYSGGSKICLYYLGFTSDGTVDEIVGDADMSGKLTSNDSATILYYTLNTSELTDAIIARCDADGNGEVSANDAAVVLQKVLTE
jgi:pectate lyase